MRIFKKRNKPRYTPEQQRKSFSNKWTVEPNSGCWLWTASGSRGGYGAFRMAETMEKAHRAAWRLYRGEIPDGLLVCHKCDTRLCVNPDHLFIGTHSDNSKDMWAKGRHRRNTKLTEQSVILIRSLASKLSRRELAKQFDVSKSVIHHILRRATWKRI